MVLEENLSCLSLNVKLIMGGLLNSEIFFQIDIDYTWLPPYMRNQITKPNPINLN